MVENICHMPPYNKNINIKQLNVEIYNNYSRETAGNISLNTTIGEHLVIRVQQKHLNNIAINIAKMK